jgi:peptidoglycan/xylan/chitin deacetylase (PgdA/CDA1 family)
MRLFLKSILYQACFSIRNFLDPFLHFEEISILAYHSISVDGATTSILPEIFEEHLRLLRRHGVAFVSLESVVDWRRGKKKLPRKAVAITFDDGYEDFESAALPLLEKYQVPVTLFFVGSERASRAGLGIPQPLLEPEAYTRLGENPLVSFGYHSFSHGDLSRMSPEELVHEVTAPVPLPFFAFPGGKYSRTAIAAIHTAGYEAAFSIKSKLVSRTTPRYLFPRSVITRDNQPWEVYLRTTIAISWYRRLTRPLWS